MGQRRARRHRARFAGVIAVSLLAVMTIEAGVFAPEASAYGDESSRGTRSTKPTATDGPVATRLGRDCDKGSNALAHANEIMSGKLVLPRHKAVRLPRNPTWAENPSNDSNWAFEYHSLRFVLDLFEAWRLTGDEPYRERGLFLIRDWVRDNPPGGGRSAFSWNDHSTAWRTLVLACATSVAPRSRWITEALRIHGATLADPDFYVRHGNHALNQSRGLLAAGCILERRGWQRLAVDRIAALFAESVDAQGVTNEQSTFYQLYNFRAYRGAARRMRDCGLAVPRVFRRLDRMNDFLAHATLPDGTYVTLGDTSVAPARAMVGTTAEYAATGGRAGRRPTTRFATFDAGFAFGRTGWGVARRFKNEVAWSARFGPGRAFHGHLDHGAVTLYGYGRRLVDDPGLFTLNANEWRAFALSRSAHNVVTVDGERYASSSTAVLARSRTAPSHDDLTIVDPGYGGVDLRRRIVFSHRLGWLLVDDRATSASARTYRQLWHLLPGANPERDGASVRTEQRGGNVAIFQLLLPDRVRILEGRRSPVQGWYSTGLNQWKRAPTVEAVMTGRTVRYVTLLVPLRPGRVDVRLSGISIEGSHVRFSITVGDRRERVDIARRTVTITTLSHDQLRLRRPHPVYVGDARSGGD